MTHSFEIEENELETHMGELVVTIIESLESYYLTLPKGSGFIPYERFGEAYDVLFSKTEGFGDFSRERIWNAFIADNLVFVVIRTILGLSPPEWADLTLETTGVKVSQNQARTYDRAFREQSKTDFTLNARNKLEAMINTAISIIPKKITDIPEGTIHRFDKVDTKNGIPSIKHVAQRGVPYSILLYERFLGRPFASHRDAVSEMIGDIMEIGVEKELEKNGVPFRKTARAEKIDGFDQAPDFFIPDEWRPKVVIEAKITQDDGTARDKVTRIQHLASISNKRKQNGETPFQVIACIDGRGFSIRASDIQKLIRDTGGKVFTMKTLPMLIEHTDLKKYKTK